MRNKTNPDSIKNPDMKIAPIETKPANATGVVVKAGPQEGTALGNIMMQAQAAGLVSDIWQMRQIIANSIDLVTYTPQDKALWDAAYEKYLKITQ